MDILIFFFFMIIVIIIIICLICLLNSRYGYKNAPTQGLKYMQITSIHHRQLHQRTIENTKIKQKIRRTNPNHLVCGLLWPQ